jgi:rhodanese-related sulfurtransferase
MRKKKVWKFFFWEALALLLVASLAALGANHLRDDSLPLSAAPPLASVSGDLTLLSPSEAMQAAMDGDTIFVDARSPLEYADGHIQGAVNISYAESKLRQGPLKLVLYCDGEDCGMAANLARLLLDRGVEISVMPKGISGWFASGGLVEAGK